MQKSIMVIVPVAIAGVVGASFAFRGSSDRSADSPTARPRYTMRQPLNLQALAETEPLAEADEAEQAMIPEEFLKSVKSAPADSKIEFLASRHVGQPEGEFERSGVEARLQAITGRLVDLRATIDLNSVSSTSADLVRRIEEGGFFGDSGQNVLKLRSVRVHFGVPGQWPNKANTLIEGVMTIGSVSQPVAIPVRTQVSDGETLDVQGEFVVDRKSFGLPVEPVAEGSIRNDLVIRLKVRATGAEMQAAGNAPELPAEIKPDAMKAAGQPQREPATRGISN